MKCTTAVLLLLCSSLFAADKPAAKPGLTDSQKLALREMQLNLAQLEFAKQRAIAPYEAQQTIVRGQFANAVDSVMKSFKLDPAKWRINADTLEFEEIVAPHPAHAAAPETKTTNEPRR